MLASRRFFLSRAKMLGFLDELEAADSTARSLYIPSELSHLEVCSGMISLLLSFWCVWGRTLLDSVEVKASSPAR